MPQVIYQLTMETLENGDSRLREEYPQGDNPAPVIMTKHTDMLISMLRKFQTNCIRISGDSVIPE